MSANRITEHFAQPVANLAGPVVTCLAPMGMVVMIAAPQPIVALQRRLFELAQERARKALEPPRHYRLLEHWN
jgi:hypothetical protein